MSIWASNYTQGDIDITNMLHVHILLDIMLTKSPAATSEFEFRFAPHDHFPDADHVGISHINADHVGISHINAANSHYRFRNSYNRNTEL